MFTIDVISPHVFVICPSMLWSASENIWVELQSKSKLPKKTLWTGRFLKTGIYLKYQLHLPLCMQFPYPNILLQVRNLPSCLLSLLWGFYIALLTPVFIIVSFKWYHPNAIMRSYNLLIKLAFWLLGIATSSIVQVTKRQRWRNFVLYGVEGSKWYHEQTYLLENNSFKMLCNGSETTAEPGGKHQRGPAQQPPRQETWKIKTKIKSEPWA